MIPFLLTTIVIFTSFYLLLTYVKLIPVSEKLISAVVLTSAQIIAVEILLGTAGMLSLVYIVPINLILSVALFSFVFYRQRNVVYHFLNDFYVLFNFIKALKSPYILFLFALLIFVCIWLFFAAVLLPPRGIDDLTYHLPPLYEFIQQQRIFLLPVEYRGHFAFPMNAELLFLWPLLFFHGIDPIGMVQFSYGILGILIVYSLSRQLSIKPQVSVFTGLVFFFTPVVLCQAGVGYIDLIVSIFLLIALLFSIRFYSSQKTIYLFLAGISIGLMLGMKYTMILMATVLQIIIVPRLLKRPKREIITYLALIFIFSGYWYMRNLLVFSNPVYPIDIFKGSNEFESLSIFSISYILSKLSFMAQELFLRDSGIGSFHGGYGIIFWGLSLPAWSYFGIKYFYSKNREKAIEKFMLIIMLTGFFILFLVPLYKFHRSARLAIFIVPVGLVAVAKLIELFSLQKIYKNVVLLGCCVFSLLSTFELARAKLPTYSVDIPIYDAINNRSYSEMRYLRIASTSASFLWETLDYITLNDEKGLDCYFASSLLDYIGPIYGTKFQNRIWNFKADKSKPPDALIFLIHDEEKVKYYGSKITIDQTIEDNNYVLVDIAEKAYMYLNKNIIDNRTVIKNSIIKHYENYYKHEIKVASALRNKIRANAPIIVSDYYGIGIQYLSMTDNLKNSVHMLPENKETQFILNNSITDFYSINKQYDGYKSELIYMLKINKNEELTLYFNSRK